MLDITPTIDEFLRAPSLSFQIYHRVPESKIFFHFVSMSSDLQFRGNNPGAVQYGNFINYYQFNPPENRLEVLPLDILTQIPDTKSKIYCLDIGCNAGVIILKNKDSTNGVFIYT